MVLNTQSKLVVNADDYGMTKSISKGILRAHRGGIVTSVSIVTNTPSFAETIEWVRDLEIDKGIHLTLNSGMPLSVPVPDLPIINRDGRFYLSPLQTPVFYFKSRFNWRQWVLDEFRRQIDKLYAAGVNVTHLDSHFHVHAFPTIAKVISNIIKEYKIPFIRKPFETDLKKRIYHPVYNFISYLSQKNLSCIGAKALPFYGLTEAGCINIKVLKRVLRNIKSTTGELMIHPGFYSKESILYYKRNSNHIENELAAATHYKLNVLLKEQNIELCNRNQL